MKATEKMKLSEHFAVRPKDNRRTKFKILFIQT